MVLWRISNHSRIDGRGGLLASARWHTRGHRVVYLAASPAGALIETLVHLELPEKQFPTSYKLLKIQAPDQCSRHQVPMSSLGLNWAGDASTTRAIGDEWLQSSGSVLLEIPSAILPATSNWLLNPEHPEARDITVEWAENFPYDHRLFRSGA